MIYGRSGAISERWHFLNNIVSSQSSYQRKQDALGHTLTALQIVYACDAIVRSLWGFVVYNIGSEHPKGEMAVVEQCDPPEGGMSAPSFIVASVWANDRVLPPLSPSEQLVL